MGDSRKRWAWHWLWIVGAMAGIAPAGAQEKPVTAIQARIDRAETDGYCKGLGEPFDASALAVKLPWEHERITISQMTNNAKASSDDRVLLRAYIAAYSHCDKAQANWVARYMPWDLDILNQGVSDIQTVLADLLAGRTTFGDANRTLKEIDLRLQSAYAKADKEHEPEIQAVGASAAIAAANAAADAALNAARSKP